MPEVSVNKYHELLGANHKIGAAGQRSVVLYKINSSRLHEC